MPTNDSLICVLNELEILLSRVADAVKSIRNDLGRAMQDAKESPGSALAASRRALEALVRELDQRLDMEIPSGRESDSVDAMVSRYAKRAPRLVCEHLRTIARYGNIGAHSQVCEWDQKKLLEGAVIALEAWHGILGWIEESLVSVPWDSNGGSIHNMLRVKLGLSPIRWNDVQPNRHGSRLGAWGARLRGSVKAADGGICWSFADTFFPYWRPIGICATEGPDRKAFLVAWMGTGRYSEKGVRLSVLERRPPYGYRHALLVAEGDGASTLCRPLPSSLCSMAVVGPWLLLSDGVATHLRVFDLRAFFKSGSDPSKKLIGKGRADTLYAFNYRLILPQVGNLVVPDGLVPEAIGQGGTGREGQTVAIAGRAGNREHAVVREFTLNGQCLCPVAEEHVLSELPTGAPIHGIAAHGKVTMMIIGSSGRSRDLLVSDVLSKSKKQFAWTGCGRGLYWDHDSGDLWSIASTLWKRILFRTSASRFDTCE